MTATDTSLKTSVDRLIALMNEGKILEAFETFYADTVTMQENSEPPTEGKATNLEREKRFLASVKEWNWTKWHTVVVDEAQGVAVLEYAFQFVNTEGQTVTYEQASVQRWEGGQIVRERFYHG